MTDRDTRDALIQILKNQEVLLEAARYNMPRTNFGVSIAMRLAGANGATRSTIEFLERAETTR